MKAIRTNIEIDCLKIKQAKKLTGLKTTRDVVDFALGRLTGSVRALKNLIDLSGSVNFQTRYSYKRSRG